MTVGAGLIPAPTVNTYGAHSTQDDLRFVSSPLLTDEGRGEEDEEAEPSEVRAEQSGERREPRGLFRGRGRGPGAPRRPRPAGRRASGWASAWPARASSVVRRRSDGVIRRARRPLRRARGAPRCRRSRVGHRRAPARAVRVGWPGERERAGAFKDKCSARGRLVGDVIVGAGESGYENRSRGKVSQALFPARREGKRPAVSGGPAGGRGRNPPPG